MMFRATVGLVVLGGCGAPAPEEVGSRDAAQLPGRVDFTAVDVGDEAMSNAAPSLDALGAQLVAALNAEDRAALRGLALTESEYKIRFFPITVHHPSALRMGAGLAWAELSGESEGDLGTALQRYGGQSLTFVRVVVNSVESRPKVRLHLRPLVVARTAAGEELELVIVGSILEHEPTGGFKVLAFRDTR